MDTLIVVVSYNDAQNTLTTVQSLVGQGRIVVWDNASTDDTVHRLRTGYPNVNVHVNDENILWTPACNGAIHEYYDGEEYVLFSNNDITYRPNVVERLKSVFRDESNVGIVGPTGAALGGLQDYATHWGKGRRAANVDHLPNVRTTYIVGASMMISGDLLGDIGLLDETMPLGADDHDYCIRAKQAGYSLWVCNSAYVAHKGHASARHAPAQWQEWGGKSWAAFESKWAGYYFTEKEAIWCHWGATWHPNWNIGTGWMEEADRQKVWEARGATYDDDP